jgi:hypothetical protein
MAFGFSLKDLKIPLPLDGRSGGSNDKLTVSAARQKSPKPRQESLAPRKEYLELPREFLELPREFLELPRESREPRKEWPATRGKRAAGKPASVSVPCGSLDPAPEFFLGTTPPRNRLSCAKTKHTSSLQHRRQGAVPIAPRALCRRKKISIDNLSDISSTSTKPRRRRRSAS